MSSAKLKYVYLKDRTVWSKDMEHTIFFCEVCGLIRKYTGLNDDANRRFQQAFFRHEPRLGPRCLPVGTKANVGTVGNTLILTFGKGSIRPTKAINNEN